MKRLITIITIVCMILILSILGIMQISRVTEATANKLDTVNEYIDADKDLDTITKICDNMIDEWDKHSTYISMYIAHDDIDYVEKELIVLKRYCVLSDYDKAKVAIDEIKFRLDHIYQSELPTLKNVF